MKPNIFPVVSIQLDKPRTCQFSPEAAKLFKKQTGIDVLQALRGHNNEFDTFANFIWCGLTAADRSEITPELIREHITIDVLLLVLKSLQSAQNSFPANN